jgi:hypothetical protein
LAVDGAIDAGLPKSVLRVTGDPALSELTNQVAVYASAPPPVPNLIASAPAGPVFLFLSEAHAHIFGTAPDRPGIAGTFIGYTEETVRRHIKEALVSAERPSTVIEKLHPSSTMVEPPAISDSMVHWIVAAGGTQLWPLLWHADWIIGMRSMALLEAALLGRRPISYQPGLIGPEHCTAVRLGLADGIDEQAAFQEWIGHALEGGEGERGLTVDVACTTQGAAKSVLDLTMFREGSSDSRKPS